LSVTLAAGPVRSVRVLSNLRLLPRTWLLSFEEPRLASRAAPGQFLMIHLPGLRDPLLPRPFAVWDTDGARVEVLYQVVGKGTALLASLRAGDELHALGPLGNGFRLPGPEVSCLFVAGGIGIASLFWAAKRCAKAGNRTRLLYGARTREEIVRLEGLESMGVWVHLATEDGSLGHRGLVTDLLDEHLAGLESGDRRAESAFVCGPPGMLRRAASLLVRARVDGQVSLEARMACGYGVCQGCVARTLDSRADVGWTYRKVCTEGPVFGVSEVDWSGIE